MMTPRSAAHIGTHNSEGFMGFISEDNIFAILSIEDGFTQDQGVHALRIFTQKLQNNDFASSADFDAYVSDLWKDMNLPTSFSFACIFQQDKTLFLKTFGTGEIYIFRSDTFSRLLSGNNFASGPLQDEDFFIVTTKQLIEAIGSEKKVKNILQQKEPIQAVKELLSYSGVQEPGCISLFVHFTEGLTEKPSEEELSIEKEPIQNTRKKFMSQLVHKYGSRKLASFFIIIALFFVLLYSFIVSYERKVNEKKYKDLAYGKELITQKLQQASDVVLLNTSRSVALVKESKEELNNLKKEFKDDPNNKEIKDLAVLIQAQEEKILKKDQKPYEEYFDLSLDERQAAGSRMWLNDDTAVIMNPSGAVYLLGLTNKSLDKRSSPDIREGLLAGKSDSDIFIYKQHVGVIKIDQNSKTNKVIKNDEEWGQIQDMEIYNGNIYLLDSSKGQIYKYIATDDGFASKSAYFKNFTNTKNANSFAIDSSIYISVANYIMKFTAGLQDGFSPTFPQSNITIHKIITNENLDNIYVWDQKQGSLFILTKTGSYVAQIQSDILSKADDLIVFKDIAYALKGSKIYKVALQ